MKHSLVWFRRDLRLHDHAALSMALNKSDRVSAIFIFDDTILNQLSDKHDSRVHFIYDSLREMEIALKPYHASIEILYGDPTQIVAPYCQKHRIDALFFNRDYEPAAKARDQLICQQLEKHKIPTFSFKDSVIFEAKETLKEDGGAYRVYTPYMRKWREALSLQDYQIPYYSCPLEKLRPWQNPKSILQHDWLKEIGHKPAPPFLLAGTTAAKSHLNLFLKKIEHYNELRDFPASAGTSSMSVYLRHGNISIRDLIRAALSGKTIGHEKWLNELIWREFYQYILDQFPQVATTAFRPAYDAIKWRGDDKLLQAWQQGKTGYPLIDAAMRCLLATGTMPNRLRMVSASFLCKTLLVDWREGEKWFARKLLDFDLAANNGGWQWCAGCGVDAQPYFRIFNPWAQSQKFDSQGDFIRLWCPELSHLTAKQIHQPAISDYIAPVVDYTQKRQEALSMYKAALS